MWWQDKNIWVQHLALRKYSDISLVLSIIMVLLILPAIYINAAMVLILLHLSIYYLAYGWILDILWRLPPDVDFPLIKYKDFPNNELSFSYVVFNKPESKLEAHISIQEFNLIEETYETKRD